MKLNKNKRLFLFSVHKYETSFTNVQEATFWESKQQKILGVLIDRDLKFDKYFLSQCIKADKMLSGLIISKFMTFSQRRNIMKAFIEYQFGYCPLVWMFAIEKLMQV